MSVFTYHCPFCNRPATITHENVSDFRFQFSDGNRYGLQFLLGRAITCPNPDCREYSLTIAVHDVLPNTTPFQPKKKARLEWQLLPSGSFRQFPDYIPPQLRKDYEEACLIRDLSPKASATLSRRCLQGMLRDFWAAEGRTLYDEIESVKDKLDTEAWEAIHAVRELGNIGAHMKADVNEIVDVDPGEAEALTDLIELLFEDWYIARHDRAKRMAKVKAIAESKRTRSPAEEP